MADKTDLVVPSKTTVPTIIAADTDDILGKLRDKIAAFRSDISTPKGRDAIRSMAYDVAKAKTALDALGKRLGEDARKTVDAINAERRVVRDRLEELQESVRRPLTQWERRDADRIAAHEAALAEIATPAPADATSDQLAARIGYLRNYPDRDWEEFSYRAVDALTDSLALAEQMHADALKREADAAELKRLREEAIERERLAREARIAQEAAEKAKREAEAAAQIEAARRDAEAKRQAKAAEDKIRQREQEAQAAIEAQRQEAERARRAEERAEKAKQDAIEEERRRVAAEEAAQKAEADRRARDKAHRSRINNEVASALITAGASQELARLIIIAIVKGNVPHTTITY